MSDRIFAGGGGVDYAEPQALLLGYANRHGLIAGATGTGKTVTLQILAEGFSAAGVPVVLADVKGDLSGLAKPGVAEGKLHEAFVKRSQTIGLDLEYKAFPVAFWDIWGEQGHPLRATVAEMGPVLIARMLELTEPQEGVLNIAFRLADEQGLPLLDFKDLTAVLAFLAENAKSINPAWGYVAPASIGAIQRRLLVLENQGGAAMFGEPALELADLMRQSDDGRGVINILAADRLMNTPRLYSMVLLWILSELFEELPEVGNPDKPRLVFFFDEAHLLFDGAPKALIDRIEQVARLIRSKGVGVYFVTQNPADVPEVVLGQLGNRVQHALRAFTAKDQRELRQAAQNYRANPRFSIEDAIREVGTGEAVTSFLEAKGVPGVAERTLIRPPSSFNGPLTLAERAAVIAASPLAAKYEKLLDRDSAFEMLARRAARAADEAAGAAAEDAPAEGGGYNRARRYDPTPRYRTPKADAPAPKRSSGASRSDSVTQTFAKSFARQLGTKSGQALVRGILGTLFRGK
ncbi:helicase HerA-like domain-containing protein [Falsigemmobacter intermedius]|uniref:helicase HerA-like domain-containing protein n=1 Tax=Falsigemmobacter intermedius TaxID=1553448 RepID=UPI003F020E8A